MPRILIADDEPNIREVISFALERAGFATVTARNGNEALQQFRAGVRDVAGAQREHDIALTRNRGNGIRQRRALARPRNRAPCFLHGIRHQGRRHAR